MPKVEDEIVVRAPVDTVYGAWHNFENFPRFMQNIHEVRVVSGGRSHWKAKGPLGAAAEWDAEMTLDEPNKAIGWRSIEGNSAVKTAGRVNFEPQGDTTTRLSVLLDYDAPTGAIGNVVAKIFADPEKLMKEDLQRFKETIEQGWELSGFSYGEGQTSGSGETLGGSMGPTTAQDLEALDRTNTGDTSPQEVDDPAER
ncbi:MAG: SRPBCC family protein [Dehalococcoidia bacterium]